MNIVDKLVALMTNPSLPANQLKRPARRRCTNCGKSYTSSVALLCESGCCSERCERALASEVDFIQRYTNLV